MSSINYGRIAYSREVKNKKTDQSPACLYPNPCLPLHLLAHGSQAELYVLPKNQNERMNINKSQKTNKKIET